MKRGDGLERRPLASPPGGGLRPASRPGGPRNVLRHPASRPTCGGNPPRKAARRSGNAGLQTGTVARRATKPRRAQPRHGAQARERRPPAGTAARSAARRVLPTRAKRPEANPARKVSYNTSRPLKCEFVPGFFVARQILWGWVSRHRQQRAARSRLIALGVGFQSVHRIPRPDRSSRPLVSESSTRIQEHSRVDNAETHRNDQTL